MDMTRRSGRAFRASQPQLFSNHNSSSLSRADRSTRSTLKLETPENTSFSCSISIIKPDDSIFLSEDLTSMQTRRKRGRTEDHKGKPLRIQPSQAHISSRIDHVGEDDEIVRCICGSDEYPGPPKPEDVNLETPEAIEDSINPVPEVTEDLAGFFLQCDICKVWQHGGCVGIKNEGSSPEEYFCERCRKDLHKVFTAKNGQRYSHYLPLHHYATNSEPHTGVSSRDELQSPQSNKAARPQSLHHANAKRRSTMNSRDAAYDEEELIRRAIEASKDVKAVDITDGCMRRGKRGRSDSEEKLQGPKRQRTKSASSSSSQEFNQASSQPESDGVDGRMASGKKTRSIGSKTSMEKEPKDDRDKFKYDTVPKRNGRADRRRADDSEIQKELLLSSKNTVSNGIDSSSTHNLIESLESPTTTYGRVVDIPLTNQPSIPLKKVTRNLSSRRGKLSKNHHIRERDQQSYDDQYSHRSLSRDAQKIEEASQVYNNRGHSIEPRTVKYKGNSSKISMTDMKRRISAIFEFISRTQLEMASESVYNVPSDSIQDVARGLSDTLLISQSRCSSQEDRINVIDNGSETPQSSKDFKDLSCRDMMDVLTKQLIKWQKDFLN